MKKISITVEQVDACLPQTQCRECGYDGCMPYAQAILAGNEPIDKCPPGGLDTLQQLADLLQQDPAPFQQKVAEQIRPPAVATIDEQICIGCTKCIQACPVDAIVGAPKLMHTVIQQDCTGCELCIEPCPVDCIDIVPITAKSPEARRDFANLSRTRYQQHQARLSRLYQQRRAKHAIRKKQSHKDYIAAALERVKQKRDTR